MKIKMLWILAILLIGCTTTTPIYINSESAPKKIYTLNSTTFPITTTALFYSTTPIKDIDGDITYKLNYLPINENLEFSRNEIEGLYVRFSVVNLQKHIYNVNYFLNISYSNGNSHGKNVLFGRSMLDSRTFTISIPTPDGMEKASFKLFITDDKGKELLRIGDFKYRVYTPIVSKNQ